jgi:hypothetical protein
MEASLAARGLGGWLDATDVNGDGSTPADGASVAAWLNKAAGGS